MTLSWRLVRVAAATLVLGAVPPYPASGFVVIPAELVEMADDARAIVHGRVTAVRSQWSAGRRRIESLVLVSVSGYFKGDLGPTVIVRTLGGTMGAYRSVVIGAPVLKAGDEVVLFLAARGPTIPTILGLGQGVFRVVREPGTGRRVVKPTLLARSGLPRRLIRGDPARRPMPLEEFGDRLRRAVEELGAVGRPR